MERSRRPIADGAIKSLTDFNGSELCPPEDRPAGQLAGGPPRDVRVGVGAYRTHVGPYHPASMKRSGRCMPTTLPLYLKWNNLLSFDREQLIFTYVVGGV